MSCIANSYIDICGMAFKICEVDADHPELDGDYGACSYKDYTIFVRQGMPTDLLINTLVHEAQHMLWEHGGMADLMAKELGIDRKDESLAKFEELWIQFQTPHLISIVESVSGIIECDH